MATFLIAFPFRLTPNGAVAVLEEGTSDYYANELAVLMLTQPEERPLVPEYGMDDQTFNTVYDRQQLEDKVRMFGPPVTITGLDTTYTRDGSQSLTVTFEPESEDDDYSGDDNNNDDILNAFA